LGDKRQDSRSAVKFIDEQIKHYEETLQASENRLKEFKLKYMGVSTRDGQDYFGRLSRLQGDIENAKLDLQAAEQTRDAYKRELAGETATYLPEQGAGSQSREAVPEIDARLAVLKKELDDESRKYTDEHPDVVATKRLIAQLEQQRKTEIEARRKAAGESTASPVERNPVYQQIRVALADAEANVASSRARLSALQGQYQALKTQASLVPQVEAEFTQLTRDYDVQKKTYETLLARREAAGMGVGAQDTGGAQFRVIDPPRVLPDPVPPTRLMLLGIAFAGSLLIGLLASFVANETVPIFHDARRLGVLSKRPILGMVSMLPSEALMRRRRRDAYLFAGGLGALVICCIGVVVVTQVSGRIL
jgi:polysaccharide chain length determinant protein (PEP-CTERM system associated)